MGRPTKLTPETQKKIVEAISVGTTYLMAAQYAGVTYDSFNGWVKRGENAKSGIYFEFFQAVKIAEAKAVLRWSALIDKAANDGQWQAAAWKLERRYPNIYGRTVQDVRMRGQLDVKVSEIDAAIERELARLAGGGEAEAPGEASGA